MKKILGLLVIVLGFTGCSTPIIPEVELPTQSEVEESTQDETEEPPQNKVEQNKIEWVSNGSRTATTLDCITLEIYKVPIRDHKYIHSEKEHVETTTLHRGEVRTFPSPKDYNYKYVTSIYCVEFDSYNVFAATRDEINIFDYENTVGMESSHYYACQLRTSNIEIYGDTAGHKIWKNVDKSHIIYRDDLEGYENCYYFLDNNVTEKFYEEHKDGGRIVWNN